MIFNHRINVVMVYDAQQGSATPFSLRWAGRRHLVNRIGYHHTYWQGRALQHVFSVATDTLFVRLRLDSEKLAWFVEEVDDAV